MKTNTVVGQINIFLKKHICKSDVIVFVSAFILGMLTHLPIFTGEFINQDNVIGLYSDYDFGLSSGRWSLKAFGALTGYFSSSWMTGLLSIFCLSFTAVFMSRLLKIRQVLPNLLMALFIVAFPTVASTFSYMTTASQYFIALLLAVISTYLIRKDNWRYQILGSILISVAMGSYQAYFCFVAALLVLLFIIDLCNNRFGNDWKAFIKTAVPQFLFLALGIILYFAVLHILLVVTKVELTSYKGMDEMGKISFSQLVDRIKAAYFCFAKFFLGKWQNVFNPCFLVAGILCLLVDALFLAYCVFKKRLWKNKTIFLFLLLLLSVFPLAINLVFVMSGAEGVHLLMIYPLVPIYLIPCIAIDRIEIRPNTSAAIQKGATLLTVGLISLEAFLGYGCFFTSNRAYFTMDIAYENAFAFYSKLTAKIELTPNFTKTDKVALIGFKRLDDYTLVTNMTGVYTANGALNIYSSPEFLRYYMGTNYHYATDAEIESIKKTDAYQKMSSYPAEGSIQRIGETIVVKF